MPACVLCVTASPTKDPTDFLHCLPLVKGTSPDLTCLCGGNFASEDTHITKSDQQPTCRKKIE